MKKKLFNKTKTPTYLTLYLAFYLTKKTTSFLISNAYFWIE